MTEISISKEELAGRRGRYVARVEGIDAEGELVFTLRGDHLISADHTGVPDTLRGTGAAAVLVEHMIAEARAEGFRIIPFCPYVRAQYMRHPDWADVFTVAPGEEPRPG